jgi:hypothetical protein
VSGTGLPSSKIAARLRERGIRIGVESNSQMRAVFHLDVNATDARTAAEALSGAIV